MNTPDMRILSQHEQLARIAAFASESVSSYEQVIGSSVELAQLTTPPTAIFEHRSNELLATTDPSKGSDLIAHYSDYANYLRAQNPRTNLSIAGRVALLDAYEPLDDAIDELTASLPKNEKQWPKHRSFLGMGANVATLRLEHQNESYALRVPLQQMQEVDMAPPAVVDNYAAAFVHGQGLPGTEQGVAYSLKKARVISHIAPGNVTSQTSAEQLEAMSEQHINNLYDTLEEMHERRLLTDEGTGNLMFDPERGFTVIDYAYQPSVGYFGQSLEDKAQGLIEELSDRAYKPKPPRDNHAWVRVANDKLQLFYDATLQRYPQNYAMFARINRAMYRNSAYLQGL